MMSANAFACAPVLIAWPGCRSPPVISAASGVAVIFCSAMESRTSLMPQAPRTIAPLPKAMSTMLAAIPPYANHLRMSFSFRRP
jgi:hypothetical protein